MSPLWSYVGSPQHSSSNFAKSKFFQAIQSPPTGGVQHTKVEPHRKRARGPSTNQWTWTPNDASRKKDVVLEASLSLVQGIWTCFSPKESCKVRGRTTQWHPAKRGSNALECRYRWLRSHQSSLVPWAIHPQRPRDAPHAKRASIMMPDASMPPTMWCQRQNRGPC